MNPSLGPAAFRWAKRWRGDRTLQRLREIGTIPQLARERIDALQLDRLRALLAHAERHVPYYRELFRELSITSRDIDSLEALAQLPILTKEIIRARWRDLIREDVPLEKLSAHFSGGSTGVPLRFYRDAAYMQHSEAGTYRNMQQAGWQPGEMIAFFWGFNDRLSRMAPLEFELRQWLRRMYQFDPFQSGPAELDRWHRRWLGLRPRIALGYASTITRFAEHLHRNGLSVPPLRGVFTTAESLYPAQREIISSTFGCPVFDCYGSSEVQNIAAECVQGSMHINADFVVLESAGSGSPPDSPRPLLVTSLLNYSMPFIRYQNEDCGALLEHSCSCGNSFPLMELRIARISDNFILPNGRVIHGEFFTHLMYGSAGIDQFQFHQTALNRIVLRIVPGPGCAEARKAAVQKVVEQVEGLAPGQLRIEVVESEQIPLSSAGKHRFTRSDVSAANTLEVERYAQ